MASEGYPCNQEDLEVRGQWEGHTVVQAKVSFLSGRSGLPPLCSVNIYSQEPLVLCGKMLCIDIVSSFCTKALSPGNRRMERIESLLQAQQCQLQAQQCQLNRAISVLTAICGEVAEEKKSREEGRDFFFAFTYRPKHCRVALHMLELQIS